MYFFSGELQCVVVIRNTVVHIIDGQFVDETAITCLLPAQKNSADAKVALSFASKKWTAAKVAQLNPLSLKKMNE